MLERSLVDLCAALAAREFSARELMDEVLARVERHNPGLNALVALDEPDRLRDQAAEADRRIAAGEARPLEGIPLGVKDLEDVAGFITSHGSPAFRDNLASADSTQVARLKAAGAIVVGKTNTPEFGSAALTKNLLFGVTRNPWNPDFSPGGSSGGSAAALAAGLLPLVTGSDGGGSVRIPACLCGIVGFKPSYGRIPAGPAQRWHWIDTISHGALAHSVADAALFLDQVAGPSEDDECSLPPPDVRYVEAVTQAPSKLRVGFSRDLGFARVSSEVATAVERAVAVVGGMGHRVSPLEGGPPFMDAAWAFINNVDSYAHLRELLQTRPDDFGRAFHRSVSTAATVTAADLEPAIRRRARLMHWCAEVFAEHDVLLMPTMAYDGFPARGPYPSEIDGAPSGRTTPGAFTIPWNLSGHPAATVPVGRSARGLPIGMQIVGPRHRDDLVLALAGAFERAVGGFALPHLP